MNQIQELHATFCNLTGVTLRIGLGAYSREFAWHEFVKAGFTRADMETVIRYLKRQIQDGKRYPGCLRFSTLIERLDRFDEELSMAKAALRVKPPTPRERIVAAWQKPDSESQARMIPNTAKPIAAYIAQLRAAVS